MFIIMELYEKLKKNTKNQETPEKQIKKKQYIIYIIS